MRAMRGRGLFITGTDTGAGKTTAAGAVIGALRAHGLRIAGMKPVASGCRPQAGGLRNPDALALVHASGLDLPYAHVNPYAFEPPVAPHLAARAAGVQIEFATIASSYRVLAAQAEAVVVEGIGGWRVPLGVQGDVAALAGHLGLPVLLVVGLRLGCLNHARLTAAAIAADGCVLAGWIGCAVDRDYSSVGATVQTLEDCLSAPLLGLLAHGASAREHVAAVHGEALRRIVFGAASA